MRTVIFNHNLFKEAIGCFHPEKGKEYYNRIPVVTGNSKRLIGYLLFDFKLTSDWEFDDFVIKKSIEINHNIKDSIGQECSKSFVSPVLMPTWVNNTSHHAHLFFIRIICGLLLLYR